MEIRVRDIKASCRCGGSEFVARNEPPRSADENLTCTKCGRVWTYGALLNQIGEEAMRRANESLKRLQERGRRGS